VPGNCAAARFVVQEKETTNYAEKPPYLLPVIIENRNAASAAGPAHFPRMQEVEEVEPLPIKTRHNASNLYPAFAFKPSILASPAFYNLHLESSSSQSPP